MRNKLKIAMVIFTIAIILLVVLLCNIVETVKIKSILYENIAQGYAIENDVKELIQTPAASVEPHISPTLLFTPVPTMSPLQTHNPPVKFFASITINTDCKTRRYVVMPNVDERTLEQNIGWLPGSAIPGKDGTCVLMGHRDTDFRILQYVEVGNVFIVHADNLEFKYKVSKIKILKSDSELRFEAQSGVNLLLVTCYPFRYNGHAPYKLLIYASKLMD